MTPHNPSGKRLIPVDPAVVKLEIQLIDAKLGMHEQKRAAISEYAKMTRKLTKEVIQALVGPERWDEQFHELVNEWTTAGWGMEKHELAILDVTILELNRDLAVAKALLQQCEEESKRLLT